MWIPTKLLDWLHISRDTVDALREQVAALTSERDALKTQVTVSQANFEWVRVRVNELEVANKALIEKAYGIKLPAPEIATTRPALDPQLDPRNMGLFDDLGDNLARQFGFPAHDN